MSTNTGRAPSWRTGAAVAMKLKEGRRTSWPGFRSRARSPSSRAAVPEFTAMACGTPRYAANSRSNAAFSGPLTNRPLSRTRIAAWRMAASTGISVRGTFMGSAAATGAFSLNLSGWFPRDVASPRSRHVQAIRAWGRDPNGVPGGVRRNRHRRRRLGGRLAQDPKSHVRKAPRQGNARWARQPLPTDAAPQRPPSRRLLQGHHRGPVPFRRPDEPVEGLRVGTG